MIFNRLAGRARFVLCLAALAPILTSCASKPRVVTGSVSDQVSTYASFQTSVDVCSGYGCGQKDAFELTKGQARKLKRILNRGNVSPLAERRAIRRAVSTMEKIAQKRLNFQRDIAFSYQKNAGKRGQMDCIDESLNTTAYLQYFDQNGWLKHHKPNARYASRGIIFDGRFPHSTATMQDKFGTDWAVDSWKGPNGARPEVVKLAVWYKQRNTSSQYAAQ